MSDPRDICHCSHVRDEHDPACTVEGCGCIHFEFNPEAHYNLCDDPGCDGVHPG